MIKNRRRKKRANENPRHQEKEKDQQPVLNRFTHSSVDKFAGSILGERLSELTVEDQCGYKYTMGYLHNNKSKNEWPSHKALCMTLSPSPRV